MPITFKDSLLDDLADSAAITERLPHYQDRLDALADIRDASDYLATVSSWGRMELADKPLARVASIPLPIIELALVYQPDLLHDKAKFYAWMDRHPEFYAYNRKKRTG